eukprot:scaffold36175_cov129-Isochrysis_galbana.AAC.2
MPPYEHLRDLYGLLFPSKLLQRLVVRKGVPLGCCFKPAAVNFAIASERFLPLEGAAFLGGKRYTLAATWRDTLCPLCRPVTVTVGECLVGRHASGRAVERCVSVGV